MTPVLLCARLSVVLACVGLLSAPSLAQGTAEQRSACMGDAFKFCSAAIPRIHAIEACLHRNLERLSPACRAEFKPSAAKKTRLSQEHFR